MSAVSRSRVFEDIISLCDRRNEFDDRMSAVGSQATHSSACVWHWISPFMRLDVTINLHCRSSRHSEVEIAPCIITAEWCERPMPGVLYQRTFFTIVTFNEMLQQVMLIHLQLWITFYFFVKRSIRFMQNSCSHFLQFRETLLSS